MSGTVQSINRLGKELQRQVRENTELEKLMDQLANNLPVGYEEKQKILEAVSLTERYEVLMALLLKEIEIIAIKNEFQAKVKERVDKKPERIHPAGTDEDHKRNSAKTIPSPMQIIFWQN